MYTIKAIIMHSLPGTARTCTRSWAAPRTLCCRSHMLACKSVLNNLPALAAQLGPVANPTACYTKLTNWMEKVEFEVGK